QRARSRRWSPARPNAAGRRQGPRAPPRPSHGPSVRLGFCGCSKARDPSTALPYLRFAPADKTIRTGPGGPRVGKIPHHAVNRAWHRQLGSLDFPAHTRRLVSCYAVVIPVIPIQRIALLGSFALSVACTSSWQEEPETPRPAWEDDGPSPGVSTAAPPYTTPPQQEQAATPNSEHVEETDPAS